MRIALDAMGSDGAPHPEVDGALLAVASSPHEILLVGDQARLAPLLQARRSKGHERVRIVHASEAIAMHDSPAIAVRQKKDASLLVALRLVKEGQADAVLSAGNTGAMVIAARIILGPIRGVARSPICQIFPTLGAPAIVLDLGANVDCTARHLCEFAEMGMIYSHEVLGVAHPRVGLLNIGEERAKGNELSKAVHQNLSAESHINFIGNVEPRALYAGEADVVVCDGFVGNVVLKTSEAVSAGLRTAIMRELTATWASRIGAALCMGAFRRLKKRVDPTEYGGAPLLGVNGIVFILHGASTAVSVANAIRGAAHAADVALNERIREGIKRLRGAEAHAAASDPVAPARRPRSPKSDNVAAKE